jgi:virulence-associated protein VagC
MGRIGTWAEMAAAEKVVFIGFVNVRSSLLVAPFAGIERRMSTAPVAIGLPVEGRDPVILDFATSAVAEGKALVTLQGGKPLPPDVLIGPDGQRSNDPKLLYGEVAPGAVANPMSGPGALRALAEHKGSGLAFVTELLAGALTGAGCAGPLPRPYCNNMLAIFLDVAAFDAGGGFAAEIKSYIEFFTSSKPEKEGGQVLVPGDPERLARKERLANGVPMSGGAWEDILRTAAKVGSARMRSSASWPERTTGSKRVGTCMAPAEIYLFDISFCAGGGCEQSEALLVRSFSGRALPKDYRFDASEVRIRRHGKAVILEPVASDWAWLDQIIGPVDEDFAGLPRSSRPGRIVRRWTSSNEVLLDSNAIIAILKGIPPCLSVCVGIVPTTSASPRSWRMSCISGRQRSTDGQQSDSGRRSAIRSGSHSIGKTPSAPARSGRIWRRRERRSVPMTS